MRVATHLVLQMLLAAMRIVHIRSKGGGLIIGRLEYGWIFSLVEILAELAVGLTI